MLVNDILSKVSGDVAYELFVSNHPFPLHEFITEWKEGKYPVAAGTIIAITQAFTYMQSIHDGTRDGTYRPKIAI